MVGETREVNVYFYRLPLKVKLKELYEEGMVMKDRFLYEVIDKFEAAEIENGKEIFHKEHNILVTEDNFVVAMREETVMHWQETMEEQERGFNMRFESAIDLLAKGKPMRRECWEPGKFIFRQVPSKIPAETITKMTSLPSDVKNIFVLRAEYKELDHIQYQDQIAWVNSENLIRNWACSVEDIFAHDWEIYEE